MLRKPLQASEKQSLLAHLHFLIETALFGQIAYVTNIGLGQLMAVEKHTAAVRSGDMVDDADESGLARAVGAQQSVDLTFGNAERDIVKRTV